MGLDEKVPIFTHFSTSVSHPSLFMTPFRLLLLRFVAAVSRPLLSEMPLWLCFVVLNNWHDVGALLHGTVPVTESWPLLMGGLCGYVLACICAWVNRLWLRMAAYGVGVALFAVNRFLWLHFQLLLGPEVWQMVGETHAAEAGEFMRTYVWQPALWPYVLLPVLALVVAWRVEKGYAALRRRVLAHRALRLWVGVPAVGALCAALTLLPYYIRLFTARDTDALSQMMYQPQIGQFDPVSRMCYTAAMVRVARRELDMAVRTCHECLGQATLAAPADTLTMVVVVGESYIRQHAALYGYDLPTTPCMQREQEAGRLLAFTQVLAPFHSTSAMLRNLFCLNSVAASEDWAQKPMFTVLARSAGYHVAFWSMQRTFAKDEPFTFALNSFLYHPEIAPHAYSATNGHGFRYDGELVADGLARYPAHRPAAPAASAAPATPHRLLVFHLMGQHFAAADRFPHIPAFERFKPADVPNRQRWMTPEKRQAVADYDNATLYNDSVMGMLFQHFRHDNAVLLYLSDHGEEVYDAHDNMGRRCNPADPASLRLQHEVPFVLWMSDVYRQRHPEVVARAQAALHRPYMTDNVGHLLLALAGIRTPYYIKERDLLSPAFRPQPRLLHGTDDYDRLCGGQ